MWCHHYYCLPEAGLQKHFLTWCKSAKVEKFSKGFAESNLHDDSCETIVRHFQTFGQTLNCLVHCTGRVIGNDRCEKLEHQSTLDARLFPWPFVGHKGREKVHWKKKLGTCSITLSNSTDIRKTGVWFAERLDDDINNCLRLWNWGGAIYSFCSIFNLLITAE